MAEKKSDPTIKSGAASDPYPEGTHPARPASETEHAASKLKYADNPDKPDPTTVAQIQEVPDDWPGQR